MAPAPALDLTTLFEVLSPVTDCLLPGTLERPQSASR